MEQLKNTTLLEQLTNTTLLEQLKHTALLEQLKHTTLLEQFQNPIEKSQKETQSIILTHKYMTCLSTDTSIKSGGVKLVLWAQTSPLSEMTDAVMQVLSPYERN